MAPAPEIGQNQLKRSAHEVASLLSEVIRSLRFYAAAGYSGGDCSIVNLESMQRWTAPDCLLVKDSRSADTEAGPVSCKGCSLQARRIHMMDGAGCAGAKLMFVIGYPSFPADTEKTPYAGEAGLLLTRILSAMKLTSDDVYVSHIVKCRPADGREPSAEEVRCCIPLLEHEIRTVAPDVVCALGEFAARSLLDRREPLERLRGRFYDRGGVQVMPTWHPDDIIDDPSKKRPVWDDIRKVMTRLDIT